MRHCPEAYQTLLEENAMRHCQEILPYASSLCCNDLPLWDTATMQLYEMLQKDRAKRQFFFRNSYESLPINTSIFIAALRRYHQLLPRYAAKRLYIQSLSITTSHDKLPSVITVTSVQPGKPPTRKAPPLPPRVMKKAWRALCYQDTFFVKHFMKDCLVIYCNETLSLTRDSPVWYVSIQDRHGRYCYVR